MKKKEVVLKNNNKIGNQRKIRLMKKENIWMKILIFLIKIKEIKTLNKNKKKIIKIFLNKIFKFILIILI
jgi:hypothetical protein